MLFLEELKKDTKNKAQTPAVMPSAGLRLCTLL